MTLIQSWIASLNLLMPPSLQRMLKSTVNRFLLIYTKAWPVLIAQLALLIPLIFLAPLTKLMPMIERMHTAGVLQTEELTAMIGELVGTGKIVLFMIALATYAVIMAAFSLFYRFIMYLAVRSTTEQKSLPYFRRHLSSHWSLVIILLLVPPLTVTYGGTAGLTKAGLNPIWFTLGMAIGKTLNTGLLTLPFFYLDGRPSFAHFISSIRRTITMLFYNLPLFAVLAVAMLLLGMLPVGWILPRPFGVFAYQTLLVMPFVAGVIATVYDALRQQQPALYESR